MPTLDIKFRTLHDAILGGFGVDIGKNIYVTLGADGFWHLTDWHGKRRDAIYLCFPTLSENDPAWLEATQS